MINILGTILPVLSGGWAVFGYMLGKNMPDIGPWVGLLAFGTLAFVYFLLALKNDDLKYEWKRVVCLILLGAILTGIGFVNESFADSDEKIDTTNSAYTETVDSVTESSNSEYTIIGETDEVVIMQDENGNFITVDKNN